MRVRLLTNRSTQAARSSRTRPLNMFVVLMCVFSFGLWGNSAAASDDKDADRQPVKVARDITKKANCKLQVNGADVPCPAGMVVGDFVVTKKEAIAAGEEYVAPTGDAAADDAALDKIMKDAGSKAREKEKAAGTSPVRVSACGGNQRADFSYDAIHFPHPYPAIKVVVYYDVTWYNGVCNSVGVNSSETDWARWTGVNAWLDYTAFHGRAYYPGCPTNIPHTSNYPTPMYGVTGDRFYHSVENGCNFWDAHTSSSIPLH